VNEVPRLSEYIPNLLGTSADVVIIGRQETDIMTTADRWHYRVLLWPSPPRSHVDHEYIDWTYGKLAPA